MEQRFKRFLLVYLAVHALVDLTVAVIVYHQLGILAPSMFLMAISVLFSVPLYVALREESFHWRAFRRAGPVDMEGDPVAYWVTFAVLVLFHLAITVAVIQSISW